jgi:hypothetical protein
MKKLSWAERLALKIVGNDMASPEPKSQQEGWEDFNSVAPHQEGIKKRKEALSPMNPYETSTQPHQESLIDEADFDYTLFEEENENEETKQSLKVSRLGEELLQALNTFGQVRKNLHLNPYIIKEDLWSDKTEGVAWYYVGYNKDITPYDINSFIKPNGAFLANINATIISDGIDVAFAGDNSLRIRIANGRV